MTTTPFVLYFMNKMKFETKLKNKTKDKHNKTKYTINSNYFYKYLN